jgi:alpha-N-arabinofuranosidase
VEYIAIHRYWGTQLNDTINNDPSPNVYLGDWAGHFEDYISTTANQIKVAKIQHKVPNKPFYIAFTEWAPRGRNQMQTLAGALHFNLFIRHADMVKRANYTLFTSLLSQNAGTGGAGESFKTPFFYMYKLFSTNVKGKSLDTYVKSGTFNGKVYKNIPYLDVSSSYSEADQTVVINVVNRNMEKSISADIISDTGEFKGDGTVTVINSEDVNKTYTYENRQQYPPASSSVKANGRSFRYSFAPHSFTQIKVRVE